MGAVEHNGSIRAGKSIWGGNSKVLGLDKKGTPSMITKIIAVIVFGSIGAVLGQWTIDREPPVQVLDRKVDTETVQPGGRLKVTYLVERHRSCAVDIDRFLMDSTGVRTTLADVSFGAAPGPLGQQRYSFVITIPVSFAEGQAYYKAIASYACNPLQKLWPIVTDAPPLSFRVEGDPVDVAPVEVIPH